MEHLQRKILIELQTLGDPKRAEIHQRYHKSKRIHWGVSVPQCEKIANAYAKGLSEKELVTLAEHLWMSGLFDPMICASKILSISIVKPSQSLWKLIHKFLQDVDGWALEDSLCHVAWKCVLDQQKRLDDVQKWTQHKNFWYRRAALVYTLPFAKPGQDPERMLKWAASYTTDPEWFIQKAIGWWLRVLGQHNPKRVVKFLDIHWDQLKGVARKEATRKLPEKWKFNINKGAKNDDTFTS